MAYLWMFAPVAMLWCGIALGGVWLWLLPSWQFVLAPLVERLPTTQPAASTLGLQSIGWRLLPWCAAAALTATLACVLVRVSHLAAWEILGATLSLGILTGTTGMATAHELLHRRAPVERALAVLLTSLVHFTPFCIEHVPGHHRRVGLPDDPSTARLGEPFHAFLPRYVVGIAAAAWRFDRTRLRLRRQTGLLLGLDVAIMALFGPVALLVHVAQSAFAVTLLALGNYVQHYGLRRGVDRRGRMEPVGPTHAWDAGDSGSNWLLLNLGRHAHHHVSPALRFERLRPEPAAPQLPCGYAGLMLLALVPPLWRRMMDPRVEPAGQPSLPQSIQADRRG